MAVIDGVPVYSMEPICGNKMAVELPTCMYKMKSIYSTTNKTDESFEASSALKELETHQESILHKLENIKRQLEIIRKDIKPASQVVSSQMAKRPQEEIKHQDIVINCCPKRPPYSLSVLYQLLKKERTVAMVNYVHSSVVGSTPGQMFACPEMTESRTSNSLIITVIWKALVDENPVMIINPITQAQISGEMNIIRYLDRMLSSSYENLDPVESTNIDNWLDHATTLITKSNNKERQSVISAMNTHLGKQEYLSGKVLNLADIAMWSAFMQTESWKNAPTNVERWWKLLSQNPVFTNFVV